jgi:hypothetical protein
MASGFMASGFILPVVSDFFVERFSFSTGTHSQSSSLRSYLMEE